MKRVFSGIQPTGNLTLGNYLGAIKNWVVMQDEYECIFCIVDLHAITMPQNPTELKEACVKNLAMYIASGLDPKKSVLFIQSSVRAHAELGWILGCNTPLGWLKRMTQFKDKSGKHQENACLGLFAYPVLQAADILLYHTTHVPVGEDQKQHIELARDIAGAFNRNFNVDYFTLPEATIPKESARIMSLRDGTKKMSKSDPSDFSRINLVDSPDLIMQKIKKATTDAIPGIYFDEENRPEVSNLLNIYSSFADVTVEQAVSRFRDYQTSKFKEELGQAIIDKLSPIQGEYHKLIGDKAYLDSVANIGNQKANAQAEKTLREVKEIVGLFA